VLFGGNNLSNLSDTWEWDGSQWIDRTPSGSNPPARRSHAMAYDSARGRVVLFGGYGSGPLADTWEWDGSQWMQIAPATSPPARYAHALVYDQARSRVILFGGTTGFSLLSDMWEWDGSHWTELTPALRPSPRASHALAYDSARRRVVLFGGCTQCQGAGELFADTWEWDGVQWTQQTLSINPPARSSAGMAYDSARGRVVLFGGNFGASGTFNDTWEYGP
jgi:hypothetical protein